MKTEHVTKITEKKQEKVRELQEAVQQGSQYIFTDYRGSTVKEMSEFRQRLREENVEYMVVKNRFLRIALQNLGVSGLDDLMVGPTAVAIITSDDPAGGVKTIVQKSPDAKITVKGGYLFDAPISKDEIEQVAKLPSRDELLAKLMGGMQAPLQNLASALHNALQRVAIALQAIADKKEK